MSWSGIARSSSPPSLSTSSFKFFQQVRLQHSNAAQKVLMNVWCEQKRVWVWDHFHAEEEQKITRLLYNILWTPKRTEVTFSWFAFWFTLSELGLVLLNQTICETPLNRYTLKDQFTNLNKENVSCQKVSFLPQFTDNGLPFRLKRDEQHVQCGHIVWHR